ncbi:unnamed protein product [Sphenostylis stenocarpa]|uniref:Uncharacterized protein n=1 Tax=Sphenostylis stenocarpa TaxID=92480 RepID=A0AA86RS34_9FABA|nr:unnamed protein product [Sphenostylis stenocarpa]
MTNKEVVQNNDNAVTECTKVVCAARPTIQSPERNADKSHKGNPQNLTTPPQLQQITPNITIDKVVSPPKLNKTTAIVVPSAPPQFLRYRPNDLRQQPLRTVDFLSQMEARCSIPIKVWRENPPTKAALAEWASSLRLGDGKRKPVDLKLKHRTTLKFKDYNEECNFCNCHSHPSMDR